MMTSKTSVSLTSLITNVHEFIPLDAEPEDPPSSKSAPIAHGPKYSTVYPVMASLYPPTQFKNIFTGQSVLYGGQSVHGSPSSTVSSFPKVIPETSK